MKIGETELNAGDPIGYIRYPFNGHTNPKHLKGLIAHTTDTIVTINLGKYRDSFTLQDLVCGVIEIPGLPSITLTSSKAKEHYRNPVRAEILGEPPDQITKTKKEVIEVKKPIPKPSDDELKNVYSDGKKEIKFVQEFYGISKSTARKWLKEAGLMADRPFKTTALKTEEPIDEEHSNAITLKAGETLVQGTVITMDGKEPPTMKVIDQRIIPNLRLPNGYVNWNKAWPIVQAELDKGRDKYEVAAELKIGKDAMKNKCQKTLGKTIARPMKMETKPTILHFPPMSREELLVLKIHYDRESRLIDLIISCIDKTLAEARTDKEE